MPDPRNTVNFEGIAAKSDTFIAGSTIVYDATKAGGSASVGLAVSLSAAGTVDLTQDGDSVIGKLVSVENDARCTVQFEGYTTLPGGLSAVLTLGAKIVGATGTAGARGFIRAVAATTGAYVQATATEAQKGRHEIIDAGDATNVVVHLNA